MTIQSFSQRLQTLLNISLDDLVEQDELQVQASLAAKLRKMAIDYLKNPPKVYSKNPDERSIAQKFSEDYADYAAGFDYATHQEFLDKQSRNAAWGTYVELIALAEKLGFSVEVTDTHVDKNGTLQKNKTQTLFKSKNSDAPLIHLVNENYGHWKVNDKTIGDGNCLYNAVAQALQAEVKKEYKSAHKSKLVVTDKIVASQLASNPPKTTTVKPTHPERIIEYTNVKDDNTTIEKVSESEQIRRDEELARQLQKKW